ncbi:MAG: DUF934 domain-containing protein [Paracoccaceae bacterium]
MSVIVTDTGFRNDDWVGPAPALADWQGEAAVELAPADNPAALQGRLATLAMIHVAFPAFSDGRGFTIARRLRDMGYTGRLRAKGHVLADQYAMARRSGFDEVAISDELARRQPEAQWLARANWREYDHRSRLAG